MIKVTALYPNTPDSHFDMNYYIDSHCRMLKEKLGAAIKNIEVEEGLAGAAPGEPPAFVAMGHLCFDSVDAFQTSFGPHAESIMADVPNYTSIQPTLVISQVRT